MEKTEEIVDRAVAAATNVLVTRMDGIKDALSGEIAAVARNVGKLASHVDLQNGRVGKIEARHIGEDATAQERARVAAKEDTERGTLLTARFAIIAAAVGAILTGTVTALIAFAIHG